MNKARTYFGENYAIEVINNELIIFKNIFNGKKDNKFKSIFCVHLSQIIQIVINIYKCKNKKKYNVISAISLINLNNELSYSDITFKSNKFTLDNKVIELAEMVYEYLYNIKLDYLNEKGNNK